MVVVRTGALPHPPSSDRAQRRSARSATQRKLPSFKDDPAGVLGPLGGAYPGGQLPLSLHRAAPPAVAVCLVQ